MTSKGLERLLLFTIGIVACFGVARAQILKPQELDRDAYVKLVLKDSSEFYTMILAKPVPDRIITETRYGRLEIPLDDINYAVDYRYNYVKRDELKKEAMQNTVDMARANVSRFLGQPKLPDTSIVHTRDFDNFRGHRYLFDDTAHVILSTAYGNLFFPYPQLDAIDNYSGDNDRRDEFHTGAYSMAVDPRSSQDYLLPNARQIGAGNFFLSDYLVAGLQVNGGITDWLSANMGGVFIPFLSTGIATGTAGIKITPLQWEKFGIAAGVQGIYSEVTQSAISRVTKIGFPYVTATYGTWESEISILGGISYKHAQDTAHTIWYDASNTFVGISGDMRVGENLKAMVELYFISDFDIVPTVATIRYFQNNLTIDAGVVFSLYKSGAARSEKTLGEYVFNSQFSVIPVVSGSYHF